MTHIKVIFFCFFFFFFFFFVCFVFCLLNSTIPYSSTLVDAYPFSDEISKMNGPVRRDFIACDALIRIHGTFIKDTHILIT